MRIADLAQGDVHLARLLVRHHFHVGEGLGVGLRAVPVIPVPVRVDDEADRLVGDRPDLGEVRQLSAEQSNTSVVFVSTTPEANHYPIARDCLKVAEQTIIDLNLADAETLAAWRKDAAAQVDEAIASAQQEAAPEGNKEDWCALSTRDLVDHAEE